MAGADYAIVNPYGTTVQFAANQTQVTLPVQALTDSLPEGWETLVAGMNPNAANNQVPEASQEIAFVRIQDAQSTAGSVDTDMDEDGLPDGYELDHQADGLDPLVKDNPYADTDRDGLGLIEEIQLGTNPSVADAQPVYPSADDQDYLPLTLRLGASGKLAHVPSQGCASCHEVGVRSGPHTRISPRTSWESPANMADHVIRYLRGTNYPVQLFANPYSRVLPSSLTNSTTQKYNARYTAQFLNGTTNYPFLVDTNQIIGTNRPMILEALQSTATLYVPDLLMASDVNGDGVVSFASRTDRTSSNTPLAFWINDDWDSIGNDDASDLEVTHPLDADSANSTIGSLRDLEDFCRLQMRIESLPGMFVTNTGWQTRIMLSNLTGSTSLRLFRAVETNGGSGYLTNTTTGTAQMAVSSLGVLAQSTPITLAGTNWQAAGSNRFFLPLIFEGVSTGRCIVTFGLASNTGPVLVSSRPFYLDLKTVTQLYEHWTVGDDTFTPWHVIPNRATLTSDSAVFGVPQTTNELNYIVFVHGWRMKPWERRSFASTAYKRMWHLGYKGRFGLFSWPTDWTGTTLWDMRLAENRQNYDRSEHRSWWSALGLVNLLTDLNRSSVGRVRLISHSMGGIPASEALRIRASSVSKNGPIVHSYIPSQSASVAHAYDSVNPEVVRPSWLPGMSTPEVYATFPRGNVTQPYYYGMKNAVQKTAQGVSLTFNFHNSVDYALDTWYSWPNNQLTKPDNTSDPIYNYDQLNNRWVRVYFPGLDTGSGTTLSIQNDYREIFSHVAEAQSKALGCSEDPAHLVRGEISTPLNLNVAPYSFGNYEHAHSAQFNSINMNRRSYWWQVLSTFALTNSAVMP